MTRQPVLQAASSVSAMVVSPDTGKAMYTTPADAPLTIKWKQAIEYAAKLDAHGHNDWRAPTKGELDVL